MRARSFGAAARQYDRARPTYPVALVDDVVGMLPGLDIAEIGAGTGKATRLFAARGLRMTCVEPDPGMAEILHENCGALANVEIVVSAFEEWQPGAAYDGLIAAQSWHWTDPQRRWTKAAEVLREGGLVALFWNHTRWYLNPLSKDIDAVYDRRGLRRQQLNAEAVAKAAPAWPGDELEEHPAFCDVEVRSYDSAQTYTADEWCDYLASTSDHLVADSRLSEAVLADVHDLVESHGNAMEVPRRTDLYLARRSGLPST